MFDDLMGGNRWRPVAAAVAVIAVAIIVIFTVAGGSASRNLPTPPHVNSAARSAGNTTQTTLGSTFVPDESASLSACTVSVSNPHPPQGATGETVTIQSAAGAQVKLEADYARTHSVHNLSANSAGTASYSLSIDHASPGVRVPVKATASLGQTKVNCAASFTPVSTAAVSLPALQPLSTFVKVTKLLPGAPTLAQLPPLPAPPAGSAPVTPPPTTPVTLPPPPPPTTIPPTTTTVPPTTTTVPPTTTTVPPTTTTVPPTTTTVPPTTTTVPPTTTTVPPTTTTVPPTTTTVPPTTTTTLTVPITLPL